jgi:tRNA-splicing ligase RtcB
MIVLDPAATGARLSMKIWPPEATWTTAEEFASAEPSVYQQFLDLANHPLAERWVCGMPDYHVGYGMPIGGVLATKGGVVPNAVGVDIGCGMIAIRTDIEADALGAETLAVVRTAIHERVPVGMKHHKKPRRLPDGLETDGALPIVVEQRERARFQIGTLGSGNHFIELQRDGDGALWVMLHSGSRNVGKRVCDRYNDIAKKYMKKLQVDVARDLAFLPDDAPEHDQYIAEMRWCMTFAEANREEMLTQVLDAVEDVLGREPGVDETVDTHHNFAALEDHFGQNLWVHRKGAVQAGGLVTIPGSMGTASYICEGLSPRESFNTCSHGAGRLMGRKEANRAITHAEAVEAMQHVVFGVREGDYDEMPRCYKDIDAIIAAQSDLVRPVHRLEPLAVVKG